MSDKEKVAQWMIRQGYATGHGDTVEDLLKELEWQAADREREACARMCDLYGMPDGISVAALTLAKAIRARGEK